MSPRYRRPDGRLWNAVERARKAEICLALTEERGCVPKAAATLGISRSTLHRELLRLGIRAEDYRNYQEPQNG